MNDTDDATLGDYYTPDESPEDMAQFERDQGILISEDDGTLRYMFGDEFEMSRPGRKPKQDLSVDGPKPRGNPGVISPFAPPPFWSDEYGRE